MEAAVLKLMLFTSVDLIGGCSDSGQLTHRKVICPVDGLILGAHRQAHNYTVSSHLTVFIWRQGKVFSFNWVTGKRRSQIIKLSIKYKH